MTVQLLQFVWWLMTVKLHCSHLDSGICVISIISNTTLIISHRQMLIETNDLKDVGLLCLREFG